MLSSDILVHIGSFLLLLAYLVRDQILLRAVIILGTIFYIVYYIFMEAPLWSALLWNVSFVVINLIMIVVIYSDKTSFVMSEKEAKLYQVFYTLSPGEFKKLLKIANWFDGSSKEKITTEGEIPSRLYFLINGEALIELGDYYASQHDLARAVNRYEQAQLIGQFERKALVAHGLALVGAKNYQKALVLLNRAQNLKTDPYLAEYIERIERAAR